MTLTSGEVQMIMVKNNSKEDTLNKMVLRLQINSPHKNIMD